LTIEKSPSLIDCSDMPDIPEPIEDTELSMVEKDASV